MSNEKQYTIKEAALLVGKHWTTLRDQCGKYLVPHHRRHAVTGIYFTDEDIVEIKAAQGRRPAATGAGLLPGRRRAAGPSDEAELDAALAALTPSTRTRR